MKLKVRERNGPDETGTGRTLSRVSESRKGEEGLEGQTRHSEPQGRGRVTPPFVSKDPEGTTKREYFVGSRKEINSLTTD